MIMNNYSRTGIIALIALMFAIAFWPDSLTEEEQVRNVVSEMQAAAADSDIFDFMKHISEKFDSYEVHDKTTLRTVLARYFLTHPNGIHSQISDWSVSVNSLKKTAHATFQADVTGKKQTGEWNIGSFLFELDFALEKGEWKVTRENHRSTTPRPIEIGD